MKHVLALFGETEIFIFVFMEIVSRIDTVQRVMIDKGKWLDQIVFAAIFGGFSIFGTYVGIPLASGAIVNIRDFAPIMAGLTAGPLMGLAVGLIGGIHRLFLGGFTCVPCSLATVLAGVIGGLVHNYHKGKLVGILEGMLVAIVVELVHGLLTLLIARPLDDAIEVIKIAIPAMMLANGLGVTIGVILLEHTKELKALRDTVHGSTVKKN
ncbi:MAG TPA: LytS/YhcK type 5TM receptor domain-containing protein [Dehalococcoidia bacterium]|jgi:sigma-B regulation protein RsbU (phosphoserine phosphatase)